jgi:hypothetical protein
VTLTVNQHARALRVFVATSYSDLKTTKAARIFPRGLFVG